MSLHICTFLFCPVGRYPHRGYALWDYKCN